MGLSDVVITTLAGAGAVILGVLAHSWLDRGRRGHRSAADQQLAAYQELLSRYARLMAAIRQAPDQGSAWSDDLAGWDVALVRVGLLAPAPVAVEADRFGRSFASFLERVQRDAGPAGPQLGLSEFQDYADGLDQAQKHLVAVMRRSLGVHRRTW